MKKTLVKMEIADILIILVISAIVVITIYPFIFTLATSLSSMAAINSGAVKLWPIGTNLDAYVVALQDPSIFRAYINTILYAFVGTIVNLTICSLTAYPLTFKYSKKKIIMRLMVITMYFNAGMIPSYLLVKNLGLLDSMWALILPLAFSAWNIIIFRSFFTEIPISLKESAYIDGAHEFWIYFKIYVPLSKPVFAALALFAAVTLWNNYFLAMMYISTPSKQPLSLLLRQLIVANQFSFNNLLSKSNTLLSAEAVKAATVIMSIIPIVIVYPFLQKYFVKGMMVGAVKG